MLSIEEACRDKFGAQINELFESKRLQAVAAGKKYADVPYLGDLFPVDCEYLFPRFKRIVIAALAACALFDQQKPSWAPRLPLRSADIDKFLRDEDPRINLVGYFAASWACMIWNKTHPQFFVYSCGVMACSDTPEHIRTDPRLLQEFPPTLLAELDETLCWNTIGRACDFMQQLTRQADHLYRCGMPAPARQIQDVIERIIATG